MCLISFDTRIILRPYYSWASHQLSRHMQFTTESGRDWLVFLPLSPCADLVGPDGSWEDGAGHCGGVRLQEGVATPGGGALVPEISLDWGDGEVDPRAAAWGHQLGGEQEPHHVGHPPQNHLSQLRFSFHCNKFLVFDRLQFWFMYFFATWGKQARITIMTYYWYSSTYGQHGAKHLQSSFLLFTTGWW